MRFGPFVAGVVALALAGPAAAQYHPGLPPGHPPIPVAPYPPPAAPAVTPAAPAAPANPYALAVQAIRDGQERNARLLREMIDNRRAAHDVVRAMEEADAQTLDLIEQLVREMRAKPPAAPPHRRP